MRAHFERLKAQNAEDLRRVEADALARGVEPFDLLRLRSLAHGVEGATVPDEDSLKFMYYWGDPPFAKLQEFADHLIALEPWRDSS